MWDVDFRGIWAKVVTVLAATGITAAVEGFVAKISANKTVDVCSAEDVFYGVIEKYDVGGNVVALAKGLQTVSYSGTAPVVGCQRALVADGLGGVKMPLPGVKAVLVTGVEANNNAIAFTAKVYGVAGHDIRVQLKDPAGNDQTLAIDVVGKDIIISLATGGAGAITSTAAEIIAAIATSAAASLVTADDSGESTGAAVVTAEALAALSGGVDPSAYKNYDILDVDATNGELTLDIV